jgi:hypothetical protein
MRSFSLHMAKQREVDPYEATMKMGRFPCTWRSNVRWTPPT